VSNLEQEARASAVKRASDAETIDHEAADLRTGLAEVGAMAFDVLEFVIWVWVVIAQSVARLTRVMLEWLFVVGTWVALVVIGVIMSFQRSGLPWTDPSDARATSRSPDR
jgi:hypothetical protein